MPRKKGTDLLLGESYSTEYPGAIRRADGSFRLPYLWVNKQGRTRWVNQYMVQGQCATCGTQHLSLTSNVNRYSRRFCSKECRRLAVVPDGTTKLKRSGREPNDYILVKAATHPNRDRCGYVPEHRLIVEDSLGRILSQKERVHHVNCLKADNRLPNLVLCCTASEHNQIHASLLGCVPALMETGSLGFNTETKRYYAAITTKQDLT